MQVAADHDSQQRCEYAAPLQLSPSAPRAPRQASPLVATYSRAPRSPTTACAMRTSRRSSSSWCSASWAAPTSTPWCAPRAPSLLRPWPGAAAAAAWCAPRPRQHCPWGWPWTNGVQAGNFALMSDACFCACMPALWLPCAPGVRTRRVSGHVCERGALSGECQRVSSHWGSVTECVSEFVAVLQPATAWGAAQCSTVMPNPTRMGPILVAAVVHRTRPYPTPTCERRRSSGRRAHAAGGRPEAEADNEAGGGLGERHVRQALQERGAVRPRGRQERRPGRVGAGAARPPALAGCASLPSAVQLGNHGAAVACGGLPWHGATDGRASLGPLHSSGGAVRAARCAAPVQCRSRAADVAPHS